MWAAVVYNLFDLWNTFPHIFLPAVCAQVFCKVDKYLKVFSHLVLLLCTWSIGVSLPSIIILFGFNLSSFFKKTCGSVFLMINSSHGCFIKVLFAQVLHMSFLQFVSQLVFLCV